MKQKLDLEIVATEQEEQQIQHLIDLYNLPYDNYTNPDLVFRLLLAEIASQRGELNLASELFLDLAIH